MCEENPSTGGEKVETFTCAVCGETFECEWSEEEAVAEAEAIFGKGVMEDYVIVCDD